jgi:hypothetical protein
VNFVMDSNKTKDAGVLFDIFRPENWNASEWKKKKIIEVCFVPSFSQFSLDSFF